VKSILSRFIVIAALTASVAGLAQNAGLITTFTNPAPSVTTMFGWSVAAVGSDLVLIGAINYLPGSPTAGAAYLFTSDGTLLTTFTNPAPAEDDAFGQSVAVVGNNRVIIGAPTDDTGATRAGSAYLFSTDGTLLATFTNPAPAFEDVFGISVASVGNDRVIIVALNDFGGSPPLGAAYLFNTNGTLLTTFTNPVPNAGNSSSFGISVAALGIDRVIIGAGYDIAATVSGAAYLFSTNGALLTTFTNPTPANGDQFGFSVAAVGEDRVLVGARFDDASAIDAGAAYLFSTNGTLLTSFTNPTPTRAYFGTSVAAMGKDRVLIGGPADRGAAYVFNVDGTLLTSITNPIAENGGSFGNSVAAMGNDRLFIGAPFNDVGAPFSFAGAAYLFSIPSSSAPSLTIRLTTSNSVVVSWPSPSSGFVLQQNFNLGTTNWTAPTVSITDSGITKSISFSPASGDRFFRLFKP
jgi:hypothetical protein